MLGGNTAIIAFEVPGKPVAKGRPRFARRGNFVTTYSDAKTASYDALVGWYAAQAMAGKEKLDVPLRMELQILLGVPQSWSKKKRASALAGDIRPVGRPDLDNYFKMASDGMNGIVFADDSQICELDASKYYAEWIGIRITLFQLGATRNSN